MCLNMCYQNILTLIGNIYKNCSSQHRLGCRSFKIFLHHYLITGGPHGGTVVKVLCYKSEGRWFDSKWCHWNFSLT